MLIASYSKMAATGLGFRAVCQAGRKKKAKADFHLNIWLELCPVATSGCEGGWEPNIWLFQALGLGTSIASHGGLP